jgi:hypothetical protein
MFEIETWNNLAALDVAPFLSCHEAWTLFCENYQQVQAFGVAAQKFGTDGFPRRVDFHRDQLSLYVWHTDIYQAADEVDLSKVEHLILSPFHQTPLKPEPSFGEQSHEEFDLWVVSTLECCPRLKTLSLDYNHGADRPPFPNTSLIWVEPIDEAFESKAIAHSAGPHCDVPFMVQESKRRHQWFDNVMKKKFKSHRDVKCNVCAFGIEFDYYWGLMDFPEAYREEDIVKLVPVSELPYETTFFAVRTPPLPIS